MEGVTFQPREAGHTSEVRVDAGEPAPDESHFFVAVCAQPARRWAIRPLSTFRARPTCCASANATSASWKANWRRKNAWLDKAQQDLAEHRPRASKAARHVPRPDGRVGAQQRLGRRAQWRTGGSARRYRPVAAGELAARAAQRARNRRRSTTPRYWRTRGRRPIAKSAVGARCGDGADRRESRSRRRAGDGALRRGAPRHREGTGGAHRVGPAPAGRGAAQLGDPTTGVGRADPAGSSWAAR